ncbi:ATP-binding protein [Paraburkholderia sp. A3BS-1L]|uniref:hybrid sensor histidine kinase/response regulator n=1 Tax=Paraburkholderia sp. A3BS-1L TaxID=3028375 RepID=UPI003DA81F7B
MEDIVSEDSGSGARVADHLVRHRGQLTRRWLRAVSRYMRIRPVNREVAAGLINQLPSLFGELCTVLAGGPPTEIVARRALHDARAHASERWRQGFALDELYLELDLLQRCIQGCVREYFAAAPSREGQTAIHECIDEFFSDAIRGAIAQFQAQQDRRVNDALGDRDRALAAQQRSEDRLRMAAEAAGLGIFEWDPDADAAVWENERMFGITGQSPERGPLSAEDFMAMLDRPEDVAHLRELLDAGRTSSADVHVVAGIRKVASDGHCIVEIAGRFMDDATGQRRVLVGTMADVTRRVHAEDALREADRRKDTFLATLAHELRNPLAPILNAAHLLHRPDLPAPQLRWIQGVVERHAKHLTHLIDDLLDLSRISAGKIRLRKETFDVRIAIGRAIEMNAASAAGHGHRLEVTGMQGAPLLVHGDPTRLTQVLSNLLDNAVKYTADGGHIRIGVQRMTHRVSIAVQDTGIGMDPALIPQMFEMFEQAPEASRGGKSGLGIGLSVAQSLMTMHGGTIEARSEGPGRGSRFTISLPLCDSPARRPHSSGPSGHEPAPAPRRVLIVDDNHDAAMSLALILDDHDVQIAGTATEAIRIAKDFRPEIVFLDLGLPDMSGLNVAAQLSKQTDAHRPFLVALTGYGQPEDREQAREAGFDRHLVKPAPIEEILRLVEDCGQTRR